MTITPFTIAQSSIPSHVLHTIFSRCMEIANREEQDNLPLTLSRVSKSWRTAALKMPALWTCLLFGQSRSPNIHLLYNYRLQLSGDRMITLDIHADRYLTQEEIVVVGKYAPRVEKLIINPTSYFYLPSTIFSELRHISFPRLSTFDYRVDSVPGSLLYLTRQVDRDDPPFRFPEVTRHFKIQWERGQFGRITELTWRFLYSKCQPYYIDFRQILNRCKSSLEVMEYQGSCPPFDRSEGPQDPFIFPKLRSLIWGYTENLLPVMHVVRAPRLQELTIRNIVCSPSILQMDHYPWKFLKDDSFDEVNLLRDFLELYPEGFVFRLQAVHLYGCGMDFLTLRMLLVSAPDLRTLTLYAIKPEGGSLPHYFDALLEWNKDQDRLMTLTVSPATRNLWVYLQERKVVLRDCIITTSGYNQLLDLERGDSRSTTSPRGSPTQSLIGSVRNLWVIEEPVEHECVSMRPYMQPVVDGRWVMSRLDRDQGLET
ncbi:hypothetical protein L218DRAFT_996044 [Marasmius fiardii PR-910]|nr:hypothetical protein L218DRAFT_996044 [Marasmius fiardii PR-910]